MRPFLSLLGVGNSRPELLALCESYARPLVAAAPVFMLNFLLYDFVRCDDAPGLAALGFSLGCIVDLGLNILLVVFLGMGVTGSITATVTAQMVSVVVLFTHLFSKRGVLNLPGIARAACDRMEIRRQGASSLAIGFSSSIRHIFQFAFLFLSNRLLLRAGDRGLLDGDLYVAVFDVVMNVSYVALALYQAAAETMQPLAATFTEEHDRNSLHYVLRLALCWGLGTGVGLAALIACFSGQVSAFFGLSDISAQTVSIPAIRHFCLSTPFGGILIILAAYYQSSDQPRLSRAITLLRSAIFLLVATMVFGLLYPRDFWWMFLAVETSSLLAVWLVKRLLDRNSEAERVPVFSATLDNANHELPKVLSMLESFCEEQELPVKKAMQIQLAVEELCLVVIEQAFTGKPDEYIQVTLAGESNGDYALIIRNSAPRFNPFDMQMGRLRQDLNQNFLDSMGVLMVKKQAKEMNYRNYGGFNVLRVIL